MDFTACCVVIVALIAAVSGEVNINVLFKPEDCTRSALSGDYLTVTYVAFLPEESGNERFDTSDNTGPVHFRLNDPESTAMQGWHQGLEGACVREKREVLIPAGELTMNHRLPNTKPPPEGKDVGYRFEVRSIKDTPPAENLFKKMDFDENKQISKDEMKAYLSMQGLGGMREDETLDEAINNIFDNKDHDRSNSLSYKEFFGHNAHDEL
ncbi:peptidyl-prolyl cis-trans isomerase FKBP14-like isoform X1 [Lytechinus variegatus]|uniref:peptidyl-prolyl cis-trans isomerase FKBP14-like isoform X1 n=1 Tax=Lytechinus variegatus TaxID=7654 RepID=UPI001BB151ED|nr:peptidyl-prolyl cis-trans isomerase FKBP14-like isoform X1 [Lytechinus variegatus]